MCTRPGSIFNSRPPLFRIIEAGLQRFLLAFLWSLLILEGLHSSGSKGYNIFSSEQVHFLLGLVNKYLFLSAFLPVSGRL